MKLLSFYPDEKKLLLVILVRAIFLMSAGASPLLPSDDMKRHEVSDKKSNSEQDNAIKHRGRRNYTPSHSYSDEVYDYLYGYKGNGWLKEDCDSVYNCGTVSEHHCNGQGSEFFCSDNAVNEYCEINFTVHIYATSDYSGLDLALYKAEESGNSSSYIVRIEYFTGSAFEIISSRTISSECSGWQVFHIDQIPFNKIFHAGDNVVPLGIVVEKNGAFLSCDDVGSIFVMTGTEPEPLGSGDYFYNYWFFDYYYNPFEDQSTEKEEDSNLATNPFSIPDDKLIDYIPVINLFRGDKKRRRRNARSMSLGEGLITNENERHCRRTDKMVRLDAIHIDTEVYRVVKPEIFNIGECEFVDKKDDRPSSNSSSTDVCAPSSFKPLDMLVARKGKNSKKHVYSIRRKYITVKDCSLVR